MLNVGLGEIRALAQLPAEPHEQRRPGAEPRLPALLLDARKAAQATEVQRIRRELALQRAEDVGLELERFPAVRLRSRPGHAALGSHPTPVGQRDLENRLQLAVPNGPGVGA